MDGLNPDANKIITSIQNWKNDISSPEGGWEANNIHIDEIEGFDNLKREEWINASFIVLNIISTQMKLFDSLILFLHLDLKYSSERLALDGLSLNWLKDNVSEYTPPSFHYTSIKYYNDFYEKELVKCDPDYSILELIQPSVKLDFFYRTYFDEDEDLYSREIYVFLKYK